MDLSQAKHAFITGGASGIGLGIADALARRGVPVTIADIDREELEARVAERAGKVRGQLLDVRDRQAWATAKAEAEAALGSVDILVNNAGIGPEGQELADSDPVAVERILAINVMGVFNGVFAFAGEMRAQQRGHIVNTGSMAGLSSARVPRIGSYSASKFAVVALTEALREEMEPHGVGVSCLCPGLVASNFSRTTHKLGGRTRPLDFEKDPRVPPLKAGMDPAQVGEITAEGISRNQAYIITHPDGWPDVAVRMRALEAAFAEAAGR
jgi:NAD(P)-dependent dehydrogenase (short-subunit alcohol dehydrogenase family)